MRRTINMKSGDQVREIHLGNGGEIDIHQCPHGSVFITYFAHVSDNIHIDVVRRGQEESKITLKYNTFNERHPECGEALVHVPMVR